MQVNRAPSWLIDKRFRVCQSCDARVGCAGQATLFDELPACPKKLHHSTADELKWERAWPQHADRVSGCCDSALQML